MERKRGRKQQLTNNMIIPATNDINEAKILNE